MKLGIIKSYYTLKMGKCIWITEVLHPRGVVFPPEIMTFYSPGREYIFEYTGNTYWDIAKSYGIDSLNTVTEYIKNGREKGLYFLED